MTAQAQAEKEKREKEERERKEREEQRQARLANKGGRPSRAIPRKVQEAQQTPSEPVPSPDMLAAENRANGLTMDGLEDIFEEGF